jgi:sulfur relay protein TusB/DsrH
LKADAIWSIALQKARGEDVAVLLIHDAVYSSPQEGVKTYACADDIRARGIISDAELVDYEGIVRLIFEHELVICW